MANSRFRLHPSAASVWMSCAGSVQLQERYPETESGDEAAEGNAAHWVNTQLIAGIIPTVGSYAPNQHVVTSDMITHGNHWLSVIRESGCPLAIETPVHSGAIHSEHGGTPDAFALDYPARTLHLYDYKYGFGYIEVFENWQLIAYALEILHGLRRVDGQEWTVKFALVQPRYYGVEGVVRRWTMAEGHLISFREQMRLTATLALGTDPVTRAGPQCEHCTARHVCTTLQRAASNIMAVTGQAVPFELPPAAVGTELARLTSARDVLDARISGLEQQAASMIRSGSRVSGYELAPTQTRLKWTVDANQVATLGRMMGVAVTKPVEVITPTQAKAAGMSDALIAAYAERPPSANKLQRVSLSATAKLGFGQ